MSSIARAVSFTFQTTAAAISMGLPRLSFTLSFSLLKLRRRSDYLLLVQEGIRPAQAGGVVRAAIRAEQHHQRRLVRLQHVHAFDDEEEQAARRPMMPMRLETGPSRTGNTTGSIARTASAMSSGT